MTKYVSHPLMPFDPRLIPTFSEKLWLKANLAVKLPQSVDKGDMAELVPPVANCPWLQDRIMHTYGFGEAFDACFGRINPTLGRWFALYAAILLFLLLSLFL